MCDMQHYSMMEKPREEGRRGENGSYGVFYLQKLSLFCPLLLQHSKCVILLLVPDLPSASAHQNPSLPKNTSSSPASTPPGSGSTWLAGTTAAAQSRPSSWSTARWTRPRGPRRSAPRSPRATSCTTCWRPPGTSCRWRSPTAPARPRRGSPSPRSTQTEVRLRPIGR